MATGKMSATGSMWWTIARRFGLVLAKGQSAQTYNIGGWNEKPNIEIVETICCDSR